MKYLDDILVVAGGVSVVIGIAMIYIPAAFIIAGLELIGFGFLVGKAKANK